MKGGMNMHENLDPEKIEDLLRNAPKIEDSRSKEDVFARLKADGAFDEVDSKKEQVIIKPVKKPLPFFKVASFVALFALVIIIPMVMMNKEDNSAFDSANDSRMGMSHNKEENSSTFEDLSKKNVESDDNQDNVSGMTTMALNADYRTALYEDEIVDEMVFTIGMAGNAAESLPISMKVPLTFLKANGLNSDATYLQVYKVVAPLLDEQALGFSEYHPFVGRFEENGDQLIHYLPADHPYDEASATWANYQGALRDTFGGHYKEVLIRGEKGEIITFSEVGEMTEPLVLKRDGMNYFLLEQQPFTHYLSPNFGVTYPTVDEAFDALYEEWNDVYQTAMIEGIEFKSENRGNYIAIMFKQPLDVALYESSQLMRMFEAIIATAASFGEQVKFENIVQEEWDGFWFTEVIPKIMGVNEVSFPLQ